MKSIPLFGTGVQNYSPVVTAQRRLNCFYDPRPDQDKAPMIIRGTPGSVLWKTLPTSPIRGWHIVQDILYVVAGAKLYSITTAGSVAVLGTLGTSTGLVSIADNGTQLGIVDGAAGYYLTIAGSTFGTIVDANFPNGATTIAFLNSRFIVEKAGTRQFYVGGIYDATLWTPATFGTKENESSILLAVEVLNGTLMLWGESSIEFWQDVGSSPMPYQRINGATQTWGLAAVQSRASFNNTEIFLGLNPNGHVKVLMFSGYTPQPISTGDIEALIDDFPIVSDGIALTYMMDGHPMYQLTFPEGNRSLLYDGVTGLWSETQTGTALFNRHFGNLSISFDNETFVSDTSTGNIYQLDYNAFTDNGALIKRQVRTLHVRNAGNLFGVSELYLDMETGMGTQAGPGFDPQLMIQVSKDGGRTFGVERKVSLGKIGHYLTRIMTRRWGMARDFVWQITMTDPVPFVITGGSATTSGTEGQP